MKKTAVIFGILLIFISSLFHEEALGVRRRKKTGGLIKRLVLNENFGDGENNAFVPNDSVEQMEQQRDQEFRRDICLSARELDCERELQDQ
ncbi:hypothetical protein ACROYT_G025177 [Oculina patagonica]